MAFQFNQPKDPQATGIASLPAQSSAQGGFTFQPQAALQLQDTTARAQPMNNAQLGINPAQQQQDQSKQFADSMQAWQAARQAELAKMTPAAAAPAQNGQGHWTLAGWVPDGPGYNNGPYGTQSSGFGSMVGMMGLVNPALQAKLNPTTQASSAPQPFTIAPIPTDPQQYNSYIQEQQAAFDKYKAGLK